MWRSRFSEGRELLAQQISNMGNSVSEIVEEFNIDINFNNDIENNIRRVLNKNNIKYKDIFCFNDKNDRLSYKVIDGCLWRKAIMCKGDFTFNK